MAQQTGARVVPILAAGNRHHTPPIGSPWLLFSDFIEVFGGRINQTKVFLKEEWLSGPASNLLRMCIRNVRKLGKITEATSSIEGYEQY